jgi:diadenylate cyclase
MESVAAIGSQLDALRERGQLYLESLSLRDHPFAILDILVVAIVFYWAYRFVRGTKAASIVWGMVFVGVIFAVGRLLGLDALNWLLRVSIPALLVAIPVVFQPELRRLLERLGRGQPWRTRLASSRREAAAIATEVSTAVGTLAKNKTGALIVIARRTGLDQEIETGERIDAKLSSGLLLNIFFPNSPLHDGAAVVRGNRVTAAGVTLPLSEAIETYQLGTRHKAALGIAEATDALAIAVSEQRGTISVAFNGSLARDIPIKKLHEIVQAAVFGIPSKEISALLGNGGEQE